MSTDVAQNPPDPKADAKDFHLKEYELVRKAHDAGEDRLITIIQYLVLFSGAVYAFLLGGPRAIPKEATIIYQMVWALPFVASILGGMVLYELASGIEERDSYLREVEKAYGLAGLGWVCFKKKHFKRVFNKRVSVTCVAAALILLNLFAGLMGIEYGTVIAQSPPAASVAR